MSQNLFLRFLEKCGRKRIILDRESKSPYLTRYYLFLKDRKSFPFNIFLHQFLRSDPDDLHDHPWPYATLILKGGYWEWVPTYDTAWPRVDENGKPAPPPGRIIKENGQIVESKYISGERKVWRGPGHFRTCKAESYHRIEVEPGVDCWTLFMPGPQKRAWGFLTHKNWNWITFKWVPQQDYIAKKTDGDKT